MEENYRYYERANGKRYKVSEEQSAEFENDFPDAKINVAANGKNYLIDINQRDEFFSDWGDGASYTNFDEQEEPKIKTDAVEQTQKPKRDSLNNILTSVNDSLMRAQHGANKTFADANMDTVSSTPQGDNTSWGESLAKGAGAGFTRAGKGLLDALTIISSNNVYVDPMSANPIQMLRTGKGPELVKTPDYDTLMREKEDPMIKASLKMGEVADRLSKEADPTHGEKSFVDLISEGKIGMALQKGLATGAESLPMTLSAYNPYTMALNMVSMAGANYAEETLNNPEVDKWKRATQAIGSAALEQAVEKFADPIFKYIGGGAAGEFTETMAREILEDGINEATEGISKRIFNVIKNAGKDALGEGGEEVITSFGNDLLGEALDLIDGDKDYGIRAQWEQMKEENPDANLGDFAKSKAKEYMDSFIGGALSGAYMSGTTQTLSEASQYASDRKSINAMNAAHELGASMNYGDLYDVDSDVNDAKAAITESFVNEAGDTVLSAEFIDGLSSEDAFALSRSENVSAEQRGALAKYALEKAKQESLNKKLDENLENNIATARTRIEGVTENGQVVSGMLNGKVVYVTGGVVNNGAVTLPNGENGPVLVVDSTTGDKMTVRSEEISSASTIDSQKLIGDVETFFRNSEAQNRDAARNTMSVRAKHRAIQPYAGKKILVDLGNGTTEVFVQKIFNNGDVVIKGKKGDLGGQSILTLSSDVFYDSIYRDGDGNPVVTEAGPQEAEQEAPQDETPQEHTPEPEVPQTPVEPTEPADFRDFADTIMVNGKPIKVDEVTAQDDVSDSITYRYTDENGVQRTGNMTIGAFAEAVNLGRQQTETPAPVPAPEPAPIEAVGETPVPVAETPAPTEQPAPINWDDLLDNNPESYFTEMQSKHGEKTEKRLSAVIAAMQNQLDSLNKAKPQTQDEIFENEERKELLQERIDKLNGMVARLAAPAAPEAPAEAAPVAETPEAPAGETPAPSTEVPSEPAPAPAEPEPAPETPSTPEGEAPAAPVGEAPTTPEVPTTPELAPANAPQPTPAPTPTPVTPSASKPEGRTIGRMVQEAKAKISKIIAKSSVSDFVGTDKTRPVMTGVYKAGGYEYASDSRILAKIRANYPSEQEGKVISPKTGQEISGKYPKADMVVESALNSNKPVSVSIDDIIAYAYAMEEIKKGFDKNRILYVKIGGDLFRSDILLTAAKLAKKHGLTEISQNETIGRAMAFNGSNGTVLVMPMNGNAVPANNFVDISDGKATFDNYIFSLLKVPSTLKGIEAAKDSIAAILPNMDANEVRWLADTDVISLRDGKIYYNFSKREISDVKNKAKDPNTYNALDNIENNGLEIPLSTSEIARLFPEEVAAPVAPTIVDNPSDVAQEEEKKLQALLRRNDLSRNEKRDWAFKYGKKVADMFATKEEYEEYEDYLGSDLGSYYPDFKRGVEESFANRQQNTSNPPVNSVPLENEPNGEKNGEQQPTSNEPTTEGRGSDTTGGGSNNGGSETEGEGGKKTKSSRSRKSKASQPEQVEEKYPARKGNATGQLLVDTFGLDSVTIPDTQKKILNTIYDFMMEMSKTLGISPKSIGQGGWLNVRNKPTSRKAIASHELTSNIWTGEITDVSLRFKYSRLSSIAHEWWHSLDRALSYFETGKKADTATSISEGAFTGRKETWDAVQAIMKALNDSGYTDRIRNLVKRETPKTQAYFLSPTEQAARAFDEYITNRFAEAGITIENYDNHRDVTQPTAEEMKVVTPAIKNLFKVLQEKEGKKPGTSVLYHIGEEMEPQSDAKKLATESIFTALDDGNRDVIIMDDEQTKQYLKAIGADTDTQFSIDTDKPIFLSNAAIAVMGIKQEKATPEQWLKMIEKAGGLKAGEDKWMGLSDWLMAQDAKTLTKQEVLDYITANTIQIEEVHYSADAEENAQDTMTEIERRLKEKFDGYISEYYEEHDIDDIFGTEASDYAIEKLREEMGDTTYPYTIENSGSDVWVVFTYEEVDELQDWANRLGISFTPETPSNSLRLNYTTDGLRNKKEIALVVPTIERWKNYDEVHFGDAGDGRAVVWVRFGDTVGYAPEYAEFYAYQEEMQKKYFPDRATHSLSGNDLIALTPKEKAEFERLRSIKNQIPYSQSRNRKILVIDEIQSKRHQDGREKGYSMTEEEYNRRLEALETEQADRLRRRTNLLRVLKEKYGDDFRVYLKSENTAYVPNHDVMTPEEVKEWNETSQEDIYDAIDALEREKRTGVPAAPFEKNWSELALKRMLRYAAENGYDAIAWTTGNQQSDRYNLAKSFDSIEREDNPNVEGRRFVLSGNNTEGFQVDENGNILGSTIEEARGKTLADVVGKDMADKMMSLENGATIEGEELRIGGEGMKGFYDKMLPAYMNKYGKKWGVKVEDMRLPQVEFGLTMHSVPVTEAMKQSVMEGQPMFYKTPNGIVYGWTDGKKIYLTKAGLNPNTPIHEYTHLWAKAMMLRNPKGWESIKKLLKGTPVWDEVMNDANYSNIHSNEDLVASEALSRISGSENAAKMEKMAQQMIDEAKGTGRKLEARGLIQNMRDALNRFWEFVWKDLFKMTYFRNVEHVTDRVLFDLLNNTDLGELSEGQVEAQIAGKMGAHNLDIDEELAEGVAYRMNALELAEQLESEGFDKNQIRTATGWERGYDGKWRYEIDDLVIKDNIKLKKGMTLGDVAENNELFKAYPFLADIEVRKMTTKEIMETDADGAYIEDDNTIIVRIKNDDGIIGIDEWEVLVHEVQHAIQRYEGFTTGASESFVRRNAREILKEEEKKAKPLYDRMGERERQLADEMREEVYAQLPKRMSKRDKEIALAKAVDKAKFSDEAFESIRQQWLPYAKRIQTLKILTGDPFYRNRLEDPMVIWDLYKSYAGEVEARNAVNRMYLNDYERAEKTLEETEDTPRELQIGIGESSGIAEARKKSYGKENPYGQHAKYTPAFLDDIYYRVLSKYHFGKDSSPYVYMDGYIMRIDVPDSEHLKYYRNVEKTDGFGVRFDIFVGNITEEEFNALIEDYERGIPRTKEALSELFEAYRKNRGSELSSDNVHIENIESDTSDGRLYGQASERKDERRTSVSRSNSYLRASEIDSDIFPISRINLLPKTSTYTKLDTEYFDAIEKGKKVRAENIIEDAANSAGYTEAVYHGTPSYGFTEFESKRKSGAIFTTTARNTAANYGGDGKYASVRKINKGIKEVKSAQDVLDNATSVLDQNWRLATHQERSEVIARVEADAKKVSDKIQELKADFSNTPFELQEAIAWMENIIYDAAEGRENGNEGNSLSSMLIDGYKKFKESREFARQYIQEHYNELTPEQWSYWSYINGFEVGDVAIDAGYSMARAVSENDVATVDGKSFVFIEDLNEQTQKDKNVGTYKLYGNLGSNPLVIDAEKKVWFDLDFNGMKTTDSIAEWAKENGYTSVVFKNIYDYGDLSDVKVFFNPSQLKSADAITYDNDGNIIPPSERFNVDKNDIRYRKADSQNAAVDYLAGDARLAAIQNAVSEDAKKLNVSVTYKTRSEMPKGHQNDKGYYNPQTGEIVICTENATSIADAIQTILHEAVAHKGLRQLMGDKFNEFINRVYDALDAETKAKVDALAESKYDGNTAVAMEEYMASLAETENFAENSVWDKIKSAFENIINAILGRNDIKIGDNELRYILRASYNNMVNPRNMEAIRGWAQDQMMREEYKINHVAPELLSRTGIDPTQVAAQSASLVYDKVVSESFQEFQRQFQDAMQPVRIAIDAIQQETGNVPIEDYENYILIQNQSSSRSRVEIDDFARRYYSPIIEQVNKIIDTILESRGYDKNDRVKRSEVYKEVKTYLIAKHGLERNAYYQTRNTRKITAKTKAERIKSVREDHKDIVDQIKNDPTLSPSEKANLIRQEKKRRDTLINQIRSTDYELDVRDYSGLTALFGFRPEQYLDAEAEAERCVENFENAIATDELWAKIKSATDKTLRHSYESGLLSRQQYNDIKNMFEFYIPLRGFDESTAEDVYAYARFEGNRFNPAVQKAEGRTSLADDPIAIIMNMAESEIAQGNKNRAKQALYNYLLNRSDGMENQNSLMQIESVWAIKTVDAFGNEVYVIASPDHAAGETLEEFEERMQVMADAGLAKKSQKGHVDVGMRFQKPSNKDAHYVYLKVNGVEKAIYINGNPKAADAINGTYAPMPSKTMQAVKDVQRLVSSTFTNYSLEFTARNYFRDMVYSHINIGVRESDPAYRKKFRQNWRHNNMRAMLKMLTAYRAGEYDGRPLTADEAAFVEFMNNGGQTGYTLINSVEAHKKELERAIERMQNGIVKGGVKDTTIFRYTLGGIELLNEASELVTRFAAFKTSRDMGRGINRSINDAKEVTVNFNTKGAQDGTGWMGVVARYLGAVKYFFNASVQGVQNLGAAFQKNKLKFGTVVGGTIGLGMMMPILQGALSELMGGDEDEYWNIPEYDRQNNLCFVIGKGKYVKLPLPIGFREMYGLGDLIIAGFANKKFVRNPLSVGMDVANKIATIVLPINPLEGSANGLSLIESGQDMLLPDFTQGMLQNRTNTDFKGVPIQKEYTYNENDPQWTKAFANNPAWLTGLSKWCYENIGIDGEGWDWSPEKLDNTFSNAFGGIYSLLKKTGRTVSAIWNEDNRTLSNVPLVGVIVGSNIDDDQRFVNSTYWEMDEYYNKRLYKIKSTAANFGLTLDDVFARNPEGERAGEHHPAMNKIYNKSYFDFMQEWYLGHKGEDEVDENGEKILGLSQIKNKIKNLENKIKKNEDGVATPEQDAELVELNNLYEATRRDLVNDLLELD